MKPIAIRTAALCSTAFFGIILTNCVWIILVPFESQSSRSIATFEGKGIRRFTVVKSYDSQDLGSEGIIFESAEEAQECFRSIADRPNPNIVGSDALDDRERKMIGERIVLFRPKQ